MKQIILLLSFGFILIAKGQDTLLRTSQLRTVTTVGADPTGKASVVGLSGTVALTTTNLVANGTWSSGWLARGQFLSGQTIVYSNVAGTYTIDFSDDSTSAKAQSMPSVSVPYAPTQATRAGAFPVNAAYIRFTYSNGSTAQTAFKFEIRFLNTSAQPSMETLNAAGADTRSAIWTKARIETKTADGTNDYAPIYRTQNSLNVNVTNQPATQTVSGTVTVTNPYTVLAADSAKYRKVVSIDNFPANQNVTVSNLPATQAISAASLPLPGGAATATNQTSEITQLTNANTAIGTTGDAAATSSTATATQIALLKGIYALLNGGGSLSANGTPFQPYYFNYQTNSGVQTIKSTGGIIGSIEIENPGSADLFIQVFATAGTVTLGTTTPTWVGHIDATLGKIFFNIGPGIAFTNGIKYAITTSYNGAGAPGSALPVSIGYK